MEGETETGVRTGSGVLVCVEGVGVLRSRTLEGGEGLRLHRGDRGGLRQM